MLSFARAHRGGHVICVKKTGDVHMRIRRLDKKDSRDVKYYARKTMPSTYANVADDQIVFSNPHHPIHPYWIFACTSPRDYKSIHFVGSGGYDAAFVFALDDYVWYITQFKYGEIFIRAKTRSLECIYTESVTIDIHPIERSRIIVDCNRYVLHFYANARWWTYDMKAVKKIEPSPVNIPITTDFCRELASITVDHEGNFWALYESHNMFYELCIYNQQMNLTSHCELVSNSLKHNARYNTYTLHREYPRIYRIVHHPSMNKLFIMTRAQYSKTYEIDVQPESWSFYTFHHLPCATKKLITSFELSLRRSNIFMPCELKGLIYAFLLAITHKLHDRFDITGNDRRITASGELMEVY